MFLRKFFPTICENDGFEDKPRVSYCPLFVTICKSSLENRNRHKMQIFDLVKISKLGGIRGGGWWGRQIVQVGSLGTLWGQPVTSRLSHWDNIRTSTVCRGAPIFFLETFISYYWRRQIIKCTIVLKYKSRVSQLKQTSIQNQKRQTEHCGRGLNHWALNFVQFWPGFLCTKELTVKTLLWTLRQVVSLRQRNGDKTIPGLKVVNYKTQLLTMNTMPKVVSARVCQAC